MTQETQALPKPECSENAPPVLLQTSDLQKSYGSFRVLNGLNLLVQEGDIYGMLGKNGAGKTTTIQIIMGIQSANSGTLEIFGQVVKRPSISQKQQIGYVSQEQYFYSWMRCEYLGRFVGGFYPTWDHEWFQHLLQIFDVPPKRKIAALSHGMRVKLGLALALAHRPKILILDEPTAGLDPAARREFLEIVSRHAEAENRTTLFSSHIVEDIVRVSNRIGILDSGKLCYQGDIGSLQACVRKAQLSAAEGSADPAALAGFRDKLIGYGCHILDQRNAPATWILKASLDVWPKLESDGWTLEQMDLEDIFLALTLDRAYES